MTEEQYNKICKERPELKLPHFWQLPDFFIAELERMTPEELIARRLHAIIGRRDVRVPDESSLVIGQYSYRVV